MAVVRTKHFNSPCLGECRLEVNNNVQCGAPQPGGAYGCSRLPDHSGDHVACAVECNIARWPNRADAPKKGGE